MGKRIVLAVFGGIALIGLIIVIVGFAMGGKPGSITFSEGNTVYESYNGEETHVLWHGPQWAANLESRWRSRYHDSGSVSSLADADASYAQSRSSSQLTGSGENVASFAADEIHTLNVDISAGYVVIQPGDSWSLTVDGPLEYRSYSNGGTWTVEADFDDLVRGWNGFAFLWNGVDMTTTFTITVPESSMSLDLKLDAGEARVEGLSLTTLQCELSAGSLVLRNTTTSAADIKVNAGQASITGLTADTCDLSCDAGEVQMNGSVASSLNVDCGLGSVDLTLARPASYTGSADVSLGTIHIDGRITGSGSLNGSFQGGNADLTPIINLNCGVGVIQLHFD